MPVKTLISSRHTKVAVHCTQLTLPAWRRVTAGFCEVAVHSSFLRCKIGATVSPREWYPVLPDLSDHTLPYNSCSSMVLVLRASHVLPFAVPTASNMCTVYECHTNMQLVRYYAFSSSLVLV